MDGAGLQDPAEGMADGAAWSRSGAGAWGAAQLDGAGDRGGGRMGLGAVVVMLAMAPVHRDGRGSERRRGGGGQGGRVREKKQGVASCGRPARRWRREVEMVRRRGRARGERREGDGDREEGGRCVRRWREMGIEQEALPCARVRGGCGWALGRLR